MRRALLIAAAALLASSARADDPASPEEAAANEVLVAWTAQDVQALERLARRDEPDPWYVADALRARGQGAAALAFARASRRAAVEGLAEALEGAPTGPRAEAARRVFEEARSLGTSNRWDLALKRLGEPEAVRPDVVSVRTERLRGIALEEGRRFSEAEAAQVRAAEGALALRWWVYAATCLRTATRVAVAAGSASRAVEHARRALATTERLGNPARTAFAVGFLGVVLRDAGLHQDALEALRRAETLARESGDERLVASVASDLAGSLRIAGDYDGAAARLSTAREIHHRLGDLRNEAKDLINLANLAVDAGRPDDAQRLLEEALRLLTEPDQLRDRALALANLAGLLLDRDEIDAADRLYAQAGAAYEKAGTPQDRARLLVNLAALDDRRGLLAEALAKLERARTALHDVGDRATEGAVLLNLGTTEEQVGNAHRALDRYRAAEALLRAAGDRVRAVFTSVRVGAVLAALGAAPSALDVLHAALSQAEAIGNAEAVATASLELADLYGDLGVYDESVRRFDRAIEIFERIGQRRKAAVARTNLGVFHASQDRSEEARRAWEASRATYAALGLEAPRLRVEGNLALLDRSARPDEALRVAQANVAVFDAKGLKRDATRGRRALGALLVALGRPAEAVVPLERSVREAERLGLHDDVLDGLSILARARLALGQPEVALATARRALAEAGPGTVGHAEEDVASALGARSSVYEVGAAAAARTGDVAEVTTFLEAARAGAFLEGVEHREALRSAMLPPEAGAAEDAARARVAEAERRLALAQSDGELADFRARRDELDAARRGLAEVRAGAERAQKRLADLFRVRPAPMEEIQAALAPGDAFVEYGLSSDGGLALVLTRDAARVVALPKRADVEAACERLLAGVEPDGAFDPAALRALVVAPLGLGEGVKRVLVAPDGSLGYVPLGETFEGREVAFVPSGTAMLSLARSSAPRTGVLAIGEPAAASAGGGAEFVIARGLRLAPLPHSADEARAVGDVVLVGSAATEAALRKAVGARTGWRALHFACHGLMDPKRPLWSSLVLAPEGDDDGQLTASDVCRMDVAADLVTLSACETARASLPHAEGVQGLPRAFLLAGAPRVLASLWKVDDEATFALMTRFYEAWNPKDASKRLSTAAALRAAQEHVRSQERWKHPRFWAAWVLWGLPD